MSGKYILNIKSYRIPCTNFVFCPKILRSPERFDHRPLFCISEGKYCPKMGTGVRKWVHIRYLYRITQLETDDPVYQASVFLRNQNELGEKNWWTGINKILEKYSINKTTEEIKEMGKDAYRAHVNASVEKVALEELVTECTSKKKTSNAIYYSLKTQPYLTELYPSQAKIIFKCRSGTLDIKSNLTYKYDDLLCRKCGIEDEMVQHIVNCGYDDFIEFKYQGELFLDDNEEDLKRGVQRINKFIEEVS